MSLVLSEIQKNIKKSTVKVFFLGSSRGGSWEIRGKQIAQCRTNWACGREVNWWVLKKYDIFVVVKKADQGQVDRIRRAGKPIVYDIIDSWKQPLESLAVTNIEQARSLFKEKWDARNADSYIFPNQKMQNDLGDLVPHATSIYHHYYPLLKPKARLEAIKVVGYQGASRYLDSAVQQLEETTEKHKLEWIINPDELNALDVGIIMRAGKYNGFLERRYKSNVKIANFMACGIVPLIQKGTASCLEVWDEPFSYFSSLEEISKKLAVLKQDPQTCSLLQQQLINKSSDFSISAIAHQYEGYFESVLNLS